MKKNLFLIGSVLVCVAILSGCGGGSSSGGGKVKQNEFIGKLPAIYAAYEGAKDEVKAKVEKLMADEKIGEAVKVQQEFDDKEDERDAQFKADLVAEIATLVGRDIPVSYSDALKNSGELFYTVESAKLTESQYPKQMRQSPGIALKFTAANGKQLGGMAHVRAVAADGSWIGSGASYRFDESGETNISHIGGIVYNPADWANFAGIRFCTVDEIN